MTFAILTFAGLLATAIFTGRLMADGKPRSFFGVLFDLGLIAAGGFVLVT